MAMSLNGILKRATSFLGRSSDDHLRPSYEDNDIVYSKNNVCVHTPSKYRGDGSNIHHPGYMVVKCIAKKDIGSTLALSWIPNDQLKRHHDLLTFNNDCRSLSESPKPNEVSLNSFSLDSRQNSTSDQKKSTSLNTASLSSSGIYTSETDSDSVTASANPENSAQTPETRDANLQQESGEIDCPKSPSSECEISSDETRKSSGYCSSSNMNNLTSQHTSNDNTPEESSASDEPIDNVPSISSDSAIGNILSESLTSDVVHGERQRTVSDGTENSDSVSSKVTSSCIDISQSSASYGRENTTLSLTSNHGANEEILDQTLSDNLTDNSPGKSPLHSYTPDHHVSSSGSSTDGDILEAETVAITDSRESFPRLGSGSGKSEDDISVTSSIGLRQSPVQHFFPNNSGEHYWYDRSAESMAYSANLAFPDQSLSSSYCATPVDGMSPVRREHKCGIFSVDLSQMKSLRLFFSDQDSTCGQLVIASPESQYKILHFHHGGLDKLAAIFEHWNLLVHPQKEEIQIDSSSFKQFSVCRPELPDADLHPEEGQHSCIDADAWLTCFNEEGAIEDDLSLRRTIFFGGVEPQLRANVWPFLLHYYDFRSTFGERQKTMEDKHKLYENIRLMRENMSVQEQEVFWRTVQCTVEKDVVRTDRSNPCFAGHDNPNLAKMKNILLQFAYYNPLIGYTQGMSDILAPILSEVRNEADVYWCFTGLMSKTIFVTSPKDEDMEKNLSYLRELLCMMTPVFHKHVSGQEDGLNLLFCHRWILLCFKREFAENEVLAMWEACWSNYQTDYFHLFLVVAIVSIYGFDVVDQELRPDESLLYFTSLANHMDGHMVLKKARGLLYQFRRKDRIPCTLYGLCEYCGPGQWDSGHSPIVECLGHESDKVCPGSLSCHRRHLVKNK